MGNPKRKGSKKDDDEHFSDDSLEESLPPPPPALATPSKRNSIAWEVSLDGDDPLLTPGSTKVCTIEICIMLCYDFRSPCYVGFYV